MDTTRLMMLKQMLDRENPYPGLQAFGEHDDGFFFGRDRERDELLRLMRRHVLSTCFGASGLGKTSLLNAGLFPRLRKERFFPVLIRLDFSPDADLVAQVLAAAAHEVEEHGVETTAAAADETLWEYFHRATFWDARSHLLTPVLVFDQFEEIFTLGRGDPRVPELVTALADLIENRIPGTVRRRLATADEELSFTYDEQHFRVLFSFREDYLAQFEDLKRSIPALSRGRFRLTPMNGEQARSAVVEPGRGLVSEEVAAEIVYFAAGEPSGEDAGDGSRPELGELDVEPALLALVCRELNDSRRQMGAEAIGMSLLKGGRERIYTEFYESSLADLSAAVPGFIEDRLLTSSGFRTAAALEEAEGAGVSEEHVGKLVDRRVLRLSDRLGIPHVELIHDVLSQVVRESRDRRRDQRERRRQRWRMLAVAAVVLAVFAGLFAWGSWQAKLREEAELDVSFVLSFINNLVDLQDSELMTELAQDLRSYVDELPEERRRQDSSRLVALKVGFLEAQVALLRGQTGDAELALARLEDYRGEIEEVLEQEPDHLLWLRELAAAFEAKGDALMGLERSEEARRSFVRSREVWKKLEDKEKGEQTALKLAALDRKIGDTYEGERQAAQAVQAYDRARQQVEAFVKEDARTVGVRRELRKINYRIEKLDTEQQGPPAPKRFSLSRRIYDAGNGRELPGKLVRSEDQPPVGDAAVDSVYDLAGKFHEFLARVFERNSLDDNGMPLVATVHYHRNYNNLFWNGSQLAVGDGDGEVYGDLASSPTMVGRGLGHGVVQFTAGFRPLGQQGALAVHFADVFGVLFEQWSEKRTADQASWLIGHDVLGPELRGALRSLKAPGTAFRDPKLGGKDAQPDHMDDYVETAADQGGIHINSGIPNRAFYVTATTLGGYAWEQAGRIWYLALLELQPGTNFRDFANRTYAVATKEFGDGSPQQAAVGKGWAAVGIEVGEL